MKYRLQYLRWFDTKQAFGLVDDYVEAADITPDGAGGVMLIDEDGTTLMVVPALALKLIEPADRDLATPVNSPLVTP